MNLNVDSKQQALIKKIFASSFPQDQKEADAELIANWSSFVNLKGKTIGDIRKEAAREFNVVPSFLAVCYKDDVNGAEQYVNAKYGGKVQ